MKGDKELMSQKVDNEVIEEIKKEDKKSLVKFIIIMICSGIVGGFIGFGTAFAEDMNVTELMATVVVKLLETISPYANIIITVVSGIIVTVLYRQSRKLYAEWDEEDEEVMNRIEVKLGYALMITAVVLILGYMFFAISFGKMETSDEANVVEIILGLMGLIVVMVFTLYAQRKIVNFEKEMNPEKKGSVFDMKFQKKWVDSCDEAEMLQTYKAAFASYKATSMTCMVAWMVCIFGMMIWNFGYVPVVMVSVIWLVLTISYCMEAVKLAKNPGKR